MDARLTFRLNGREVVADGFAPTTTLLQYLRASGRTGTKEGCAEGDCGACSVALLETNARGESTYRAFNACIALLPMVAGREIVTVEGLAAPPAPGASPARSALRPALHPALHPVQTAMVEHYGSQCGYCTPGFVMSMFEAYYRTDLQTRPQMSDQLCGNLCRCTGYRPIRDALVDALAKKPAEPDLFQIRLSAPTTAIPACDVAAAGERFVRPTTVAEVVDLLALHPTALIVAGATEIGVELNKKLTAFPFLVSTEAVTELRAIVKTGDAWEVGGAATLTDLEEALDGEIPAIDKMLWVFASRQIRNRATLAGNLVTASPIGDMAPVLLALDASITLASKAGDRTLPLSDFFLGYRKTAMNKGDVVRRVTIPRRSASERRKVDSFKVSKRRELDISIVAAAFAIDLDSSHHVQAARLAYGGVAATPARAKSTEAFLVGKPWSRETIEAALPILAKEFTPLSDVRSGADYRRGLATSLFEKFFSGDQSLAQDLPLGFETGVREVRADVDGDHSRDPSRSIKHESARGHVTGAAEYVDDQASKRPMLEMWPVLSPHARGRIVRRDATKALALPGVVDVLFASDIPGRNDIGAIRNDEPLLAEEEVFFHGQMIAAVIGESLAVCRRAAALVEVEIEALPPVLTIRNAIAAGSFHTDAHVIRRGDAPAAIAAASHSFEGEIDIGGQEHFYLESQAAWAERGDDGDVFVVSSTQHPSEIQAVVSHVLHLPRNKVVVQSPRMGGGFGGKETQGNGFAALVALAAFRLGRPVRVQLDRDVDMATTGKRHPFHARFKVGFDDAGKIQGVTAEITSDGGWALDLSESICDRALFHFDNAYYLPAVTVSGRVAKTHTVSHTAFRGFGGPQGMVVIEEILDRVARRLDLLPEQVRERNLYRGTGATNTTHYGQLIEDERIPLIWDKLTRSSEIASRRAEIAAFNAASGRIKRGLAMTPVKFGISFTASFLNQAGALVHVYRDGTVQVNHGGTEMGQGLHAKMLGITMRELGLPEDSIRMMKTVTDKVPNTSATAASSGSDLNGAAVKAACETIRERLSAVAAKSIEGRVGHAVDPASLSFHDNAVHGAGVSLPFAEVVETAHVMQVQLSATGFYKTPNLAYDKKKGLGRPFHYFAYGAAVTEVEIDGYSGMKRILRVDILQDVGESLNPGIDRGQVEGAYVQGVGWLTGEELKWDEKGRLLSHSASTYQIPAISDAPIRFVVDLLPKAPQANVVHGSKAVGEPPLMLAISAREAIRDAIAAFGAPGGEVLLGCPATHEAIFSAVQVRRSKAAATSEDVAAE